MGAISTASGRLEVFLFLFEKRGGKSCFSIILVSAVLGIKRFCIASRSLLPISMQTKLDPGEPVLLMALKIMLHAKLCLSVVIFLVYVGIQKKYAGHCLVEGRGGKLGECVNHTVCF